MAPIPRLILFLSVCLPFFSTTAQPREVTGVLREIKNFQSKFVDTREVDIWLPDGYTSDTAKRYSVLYMHDGQNCFDPKTSFIGVDWGIDETLTKLKSENKINDVIVVAIWNTPKRVEEYMPEKAAKNYTPASSTTQRYEKAELKSDNYLKFIVEELKPFVDKTYRTKPDRQHTFIMGSSMGGLISLYAICEYPDVFGGAGCISTHFPAGDGVMIDYMKDHLPPPETHKIYFDYGTETLDADYEPYQKRADDAMRVKGYTMPWNWITKKFQGDEHSERAWRKRVYIPLLFLLGK
jgi:predicted alpha/beta superfamily hydrolase